MSTIYGNYQDNRQSKFEKVKGNNFNNDRSWKIVTSKHIDDSDFKHAILKLYRRNLVDCTL